MTVTAEYTSGVRHLGGNVLKITSVIVSAYVSRNAIKAQDIPDLIDSVYNSIAILQNKPSLSLQDPARPAASRIAASIRKDALISLIDGRPYKTLKRHLTAHGFTPKSYREHYGLPDDYPMVAQTYSAHRSRIAKQIQLGYKAA